MNESELQRFQAEPITLPQVSADDVSGEDRTLLYGYTCTRETFQVYKLGGGLHILIYDRPTNVLRHVRGVSLPAVSCVPDKRVYPESCDFEFATLLHAQQVSIPFLPFDRARYYDVEHRQFHGYIEV
jgi:hypothetical protein